MVSMTRAPPDVDRIGTDELRRLLIEQNFEATNARLSDGMFTCRGEKLERFCSRGIHLENCSLDMES